MTARSRAYVRDVQRERQIVRVHTRPDGWTLRTEIEHRPGSPPCIVLRTHDVKTGRGSQVRIVPAEFRDIEIAIARCRELIERGGGT